MSDFNMPPGVSARDIPGNTNEEWREEGDMQAMAVMTLRDVFAAFATQGLLASDCNTQPDSGFLAHCAYTMADALLRERMKP